jgi:diguanylate cyclase (GGDEF)-like protein
MKKKQHILIAEDEAVNRMLLRKILEEEYVVSEVSDGAGVLRALKESGDSFTAVVLDLIMPGMDGFEVLKKISEMPEFSNIPILVATGGSSPDSEAQSLAAGAWDYVTKPYNPVVLRYRLRNIIARSQMPLLERVRVLAQQDQLTGLYNRRYFMKQTEKMLKANADVRFVLIRLDVDRFRLYNASFGSRAGDDLLRKIAETLRATVGTYPLCTYGRIESDIFCVCMPYQEQKLMEDIRRATAFSHTLSKDYRLELSFGLYVISGPEVEMENAYSRAVIAAAKCKDNFNRSYAFYDAAMEEAERKNQQIINEMERALREKQFHVYLQPKYSMKTGCPCGAEALVRWEHPQRGMVMPGSFIPLFERNGFILQLDYYMWENVCALLKQWIQEGKSPMPVSVNVSRVSLFSPDVVERLTGLVRKYEIPVELLNLEITESAYMANPAFMKKVIQELHDRGFVILMDDFGSGYSSLNTLKNIDVDILKIDLRFLSIGERNARSEKILASVVRMAGWIGTPVVVEGVETKEQRDFLESIGCVFVQGYFYAKPMPVPDYVSLMERTALPENLGKDTLREEDFPNALWSSDARVSELLREVSAPFVLYEYSDGQVDVLRMNEEYLRIFSNEETSRMLSDRELAKLREAMDRCVAGGDSAECDCMFLIQNGVSRWFQMPERWSRRSSSCKWWRLRTPGCIRQSGNVPGTKRMPGKSRKGGMNMRKIDLRITAALLGILFLTGCTQLSAEQNRREFSIPRPCRTSGRTGGAFGAICEFFTKSITGTRTWDPQRS